MSPLTGQQAQGSQTPVAAQETHCYLSRPLTPSGWRAALDTVDSLETRLGLWGTWAPCSLKTQSAHTCGTTGWHAVHPPQTQSQAPPSWPAPETSTLTAPGLGSPLLVSGSSAPRRPLLDVGQRGPSAVQVCPLQGLGDRGPPGKDILTCSTSDRGPRSRTRPGQCPPHR